MRRLIAAVVVMSTSITACELPSSHVPDPNQLPAFLDSHPGAPVVVPVGVELTDASVTAVVFDNEMRVVMFDALLQVEGENLSDAQRYCFAEAGLEELRIPDCPPFLLSADGVDVYGDPKGPQVSLRSAVWKRPEP